MASERRREASPRPTLAAAPAQARRFVAARRRRAAEALEDYTELIADLIARHRRSAHHRHRRAARRRPSRPRSRRSAGSKREGLAVAKPYRGVSLTAAGPAMAERVHRRHRLVVDFLVAVGAPRAKRRKPTPRAIEHYVSLGDAGGVRSVPRRAAQIDDQLLPIRTPAASTSPPPSMTLAAAESGGVSM